MSSFAEEDGIELILFLTVDHSVQQGTTNLKLQDPKFVVIGP
jgi:hypothetical protein